uniref:Tail protein n=1 Tax=viral metagenome TaxID=1070528 RepID=A0A6M3IIK2_9ZZZZ
MAFPTSLDSFSTKTSGQVVAESHVNDLQTAIVSTETKIGTGASTATANKVFRGTGTGTSAWAQVALTTDVTGVLPLANGGSATTGDSIIKGWINFDGTGTISTNDSYNVAGITDNGTGDYTVTWDTDFANTNYCITIAQGVDANSARSSQIISLATGSARLETVDASGANVDASIVCVMAIGDQ